MSVTAEQPSVVDVIQLPERVNVRSALRSYITDVYDREDEVDTAHLVRMARKHFEDDSWFLDAMIREAFGLIVPDVAHLVRKSLRDRHAEDETTKERLSSMFAHVGEQRHRSFMTMTRGQHIFAAEEREHMAAGNLRWAGFHRAIAELHKNDAGVTADFVSEMQLTRLWKEHVDADD